MNKRAIGIVVAGIVIVNVAIFATYQMRRAEDVAEGDNNTMNTTPSQTSYEKPPEMVVDTSKSYTALMQTNQGPIKLQLFANETPVTVNNFVFLAREGYYNDVIFHRVIAGFMAQGGDPTGTGTGGPGYTFDDEIVDALTFDRRGVLAMANAGPGTNGSQFFITFAPTPHLNGAHTIFGAVDPEDAESTKTLETIESIPTSGADRPEESIVIQSITITEE